MRIAVSYERLDVYFVISKYLLLTFINFRMLIKFWHCLILFLNALQQICITSREANIVTFMFSTQVKTVFSVTYYIVGLSYETPEFTGVYFRLSLRVNVVVDHVSE